MKTVKGLHSQLDDTNLRNRMSDMLDWKNLNDRITVDPDLTGVSTVLLDDEIRKLKNKLSQLEQDRYEVENILKPLMADCREKGFKKIALDNYKELDNDDYVDFIGSEEELSAVFPKFELDDSDISFSKKKFRYGEKCKLVGLLESPENNGKKVEVVNCTVAYSTPENPSGLEYCVIGEDFKYYKLYESRLEKL